jgi:hypothetical protein
LEWLNFNPSVPFLLLTGEGVEVNQKRSVGVLDFVSVKHNHLVTTAMVIGMISTNEVALRITRRASIRRVKADDSYDEPLDEQHDFADESGNEGEDGDEEELEEDWEDGWEDGDEDGLEN